MARILYRSPAARALSLASIIVLILGIATSNWSGIARAQDTESKSTTKEVAPGNVSGALASKSTQSADSFSPMWVVTIAGLGGDEPQSRRFKDAISGIQKVARERWGVADDHLRHVPATTPATGSTDSTSKTGSTPSEGKRDESLKLGASREEVAAAFTQLAEQAGTNDSIWIFVLAHGNYDGRQAFLHFAGPDPAATHWRDWLDKLGEREVVVVFGGSASGWLIRPLAGARRVILTATAADDEFNATEFPLAFVEAANLPTSQLDEDQDGRVSLAELFVATNAAVERRFADDERIPTEHAQLEDDGDGKGTEAPAIRAQLTARRQPKSTAEESADAARADNTKDGDAKGVSSAPANERRDGKLAIELIVPYRPDTPPAADATSPADNASPDATPPEAVPESTASESST